MPSSKLAPCPYCQCPEVYVAQVEDGMCCVACPRCSMGGPVSVDGDEQEAIQAWNSLCRKLCRNCRQVYIRRILQLKRLLPREGKSG